MPNIKLRYPFPAIIEFHGRHFEFTNKSLPGQPIYECEAEDDAITRQFATIPKVTIVEDAIPEGTCLVGSFDAGVYVQGASYTFKPDLNYHYMTCRMPVKAAEWLVTYSSQSFWYAGTNVTITDPRLAIVKPDKGLSPEVLMTWRSSDDPEQTQERMAKEVENRKMDTRPMDQLLQELYIEDAKKRDPRVKRELDKIDKKFRSVVDDDENDNTIPDSSDTPWKKKRTEKVKPALGGNGPDLEVTISETLDSVRKIVVPNEDEEIQDITGAKVSLDIDKMLAIDIRKALDEESFSIDSLNDMVHSERKAQKRVSVIRALMKKIEQLNGPIHQ